MLERTIACSSLGITADGSICTLSGVPFDDIAYSAMKYGSRLRTMQLGLQMGTTLLAAAPELLTAPRVTAISIYKTVPSGAAGVTIPAVARINQARAALGLEPVEPVHVKMGKVLGVDYSTLDEEGRRRYIEETGYFLPPGSVHGTLVVLIDDIRITGSAEELGRDLLRGQGHTGLILGYLAVFVDVERAKKDTGVEKRINVSAIKSLDDILRLTDTDGLQITLRTMKRVMEEPDEDLLVKFLHALPLQQLFELFAGILSSGLDYLEGYRRGYNLLLTVAAERGLTT